MSYDARNLQVWLEVGELDEAERNPTEFEISRFQADFPLNDIPTASVSLATGRRGDTGEPAPVHRLAALLADRRPCRVLFNSKPGGLLNLLLGLVGLDTLPQSDTVVFDGYSSARGIERGESAMSYTLGLEHWLSDLDFSSAVSVNVHPNSPADLVFPALSTLVTGENPVSGGGFTGVSVIQQVLTDASYLRDFWGLGVKKWFEALSNQNRLVDPNIAGPAAGAALAAGPGFGLDSNKAALAALARFETTGKYLRGVPLEFDIGGMSGPLVSQLALNIRGELARETLYTAAAATIWNKLVGLGSLYMFSVVPLVDKALVVPSMPVYSVPYRTIYASEYNSISMQAQVLRSPLRAVAVFAGKAGQAGAVANGRGDRPLNYSVVGVGGLYVNRKIRGQILFRSAPNWLGQDIYRNHNPPAGPLADPRVTRTMADPAAKGPGGEPIPADLTLESRLPLGRFAHALYGLEVLKHRVGYLTGRLRFDIAPGSVVRIEVPGEKFLGLDDNLAEAIFATVTQVSITVDAEAAKASTSFQLAHFRTTVENEDKALTMTAHPLWKQPFNGCGLI